MSRTSRRWAEFRFAVVGHLVFSDIEKGKLAPELESLSTKKWKHPISGMWITLFLHDRTLVGKTSWPSMSVEFST
jgi:hypothetical protein